MINFRYLTTTTTPFSAHFASKARPWNMKSMFLLLLFQTSQPGLVWSVKKLKADTEMRVIVSSYEACLPACLVSQIKGLFDWRPTSWSQVLKGTAWSRNSFLARKFVTVDGGWISKYSLAARLPTKLNMLINHLILILLSVYQAAQPGSGKFTCTRWSNLIVIVEKGANNTILA